MKYFVRCFVHSTRPAGEMKAWEADAVPSL
jgi:hypothetical protein